MKFQRRSFFRNLSIATLAFSPFSFLKAKTENENKSKPIKGSFVHVVYFWLKDPKDPAGREKFEMELTTFIDSMKMIKNKYIGTPAGTDREVVDNSYTYCLIASFETTADHDAYQAHPIHKAFIENAGHLWERVQVFDSLKM